ncbi:MAG: hypothetical protein HYT76_07930 [Deltaproteobacteria bacterium]|nr:hypothetical protein [Deltaproteobacteria bacterium]
MKKITLFIFVVFFLQLSVSSTGFSGAVAPYGPEQKRFGLGIILGDPTGLTGKGYLAPRLAIDTHLSWSFIEEAFTIIGDVTHDFVELPVDTNVVTIPFYAGVGGKVAINKQRRGGDETSGAIRIPVGLSGQWARYPIEVFLELAPGVEVTPATEFDLTGGLGGRFYF